MPFPDRSGSHDTTLHDTTDDHQGRTARAKEEGSTQEPREPNVTGALVPAFRQARLQVAIRRLEPIAMGVERDSGTQDLIRRCHC